MPIWFKSKHPEFAWLSNFSEHRFELDRVVWPSVEHFYQAQKYEDAELQERIRLAATPLKARKSGQNRSLELRPDWDEQKVVVMKRALLAKFAQNKALQQRLLKTGEEELIHESSSDPVWGRSSEGEGCNLLGELLMEVRSELAGESSRND